MQLTALLSSQKDHCTCLVIEVENLKIENAITFPVMITVMLVLKKFTAI